MEYYSTLEKKEILSFATTWMNPEGIMQSKISQTEEINTTQYHLHVESK